MKTTDLIPILLHELKNGDKYGLEIVESIKTASNGQIEIKQPTLYPLLKKLEKSKFISSYWQDSEIGGKRHYYQITQNGLAQLETYPPLEVLIENALKDDDFTPYEKENNSIPVIADNATNNSPSPFDKLFEKPQYIENDTATYTAYGDSNKLTEPQESQDFEPQNSNDLLANTVKNDDANSAVGDDNEEELSACDSKNIEDIQSSQVEPFAVTDDTQNTNANTIAPKSFDDASNIFANSNNGETVNEHDIATKIMDETANHPANTSADINVFDGIKYADEHFDNDNNQNIDTLDNLNVEKKFDFQSPIDSKNANSENHTENNANSLDIFDALSFADEEKTSDNLIDTPNSNLSKENFYNASNINKTNYDSQNQTNSSDNLVLNNPFFKENENKSISEKTNLEINQDNAKLIAKNTDSTNFATEKSVKRFTEKTNLPATDFVSGKTKNLFTDYPAHTAPKLNTVTTDVEYRDYVDYKTNEKIVKSKKIAKLKLVKILTSSLLTMLVLTLLLTICVKNKLTPLFVLIFICSTLYVVLYTCRFIGEYKTVRLQIESIDKQYNFKKQIIYRSIIFVAIVIVLFVANLVGLRQGKLFGINNFGNLLAPILLSLMLFVDYLLSYIFYKLLKK